MVSDGLTKTCSSGVKAGRKEKRNTEMVNEDDSIKGSRKVGEWMKEDMGSGNELLSHRATANKAWEPCIYIQKLNPF